MHSYLCMSAILVRGEASPHAHPIWPCMATLGLMHAPDGSLSRPAALCVCDVADCTSHGNSSYGPLLSHKYALVPRLDGTETLQCFYTNIAMHVVEFWTGCSAKKWASESNVQQDLAPEVVRRANFACSCHILAQEKPGHPY